MENKNSKLEENLKTEIAEAKALLEVGAPLLAGATLYFLEKQYTDQGLPIPAEVSELRKSIKSQLLSTYPAKIKTEIESKNYRNAMAFFVPLSLHHRHFSQKIPFVFWDLREQIATETNDEIFMQSYPRSRFEEK